MERYDKSTGSSDLADLRRVFEAGVAVERYDNKRGSVYKEHGVGIAIAAAAAVVVLVSAAPFTAWRGAGGNDPAERRGGSRAEIGRAARRRHTSGVDQ